MIAALAIVSGAVAGAGADVPRRETGTIAGVASTREVTPKPIRATIDPAVCGSSVPDESIVVDGAGHLANVVVTVPGVKAASPAEVVILNDKCRFVPRV